MNNRAFLKNFFSIFVTLLFQNYSFAQYRVQDAIQLKDEIVIYNGTTYTAKAWVMCSHYKLILKPDIPHDEKYCYEWITGKIDDYNSPLPSCSLFGYEVKPCSESGIYIINIRDKTTDKILYTYCFVVYIIDRLDIWEQNNLTECMDENSFTKIAGVLVGKGVDRITTSKKIINLYFIAEPTYGTLIRTEGLTIYKGRFQSEKVPVPRMDGQFKSVLSSEYLYRIDGYLGEDVGGCGGRIDMKVYRLWITKFHKADAPSPDKWQVVVGEPIVHEVFALPNLTGGLWEWSMPQGWAKLENANVQNGTAILISNGAPPFKINNSFFGNNKGVVQVKYTDKTGKIYQVRSSEIPSKNNISQSVRAMETMKKATVFYNKFDQFYSGIPNWYKFWKEVVHYGETHPEKYEYGPGDVYGKTEYLPYQFRDMTFEITYHDICNCYNDVTKRFGGIETFYEVVAHEKTHVEIKRIKWPTKRYVAILDLTDVDYVPEWFENQHSSTNYPYDNTRNDRSIKNGGTGVDNNYEEDYCKAIERILNSTIFNDQDWSYDKYLPTFCQGKQWK